MAEGLELSIFISGHGSAVAPIDQITQALDRLKTTAGGPTTKALNDLKAATSSAYDQFSRDPTEQNRARAIGLREESDALSKSLDGLSGATGKSGEAFELSKRRAVALTNEGLGQVARVSPQLTGVFADLSSKSQLLASGLQYAGAAGIGFAAAITAVESSFLQIPQVFIFSRLLLTYVVGPKTEGLLRLLSKGPLSLPPLRSNILDKTTTSR